MPIDPELKPLYRTPEAIAATRECLERAGYKCEDCGKPHMKRVRVLPGGLWFDEQTQQWRAPAGQLKPDLLLRLKELEKHAREILVKVGGAHLDHDPRNNAPENRRALCQRCHLVYDRAEHKRTRSRHKDARRPLLLLLSTSNTPQGV